MPDYRETDPNTTPESKRDIRQEGDTRDPEFEMPDAEQVDRDIELAERIFGEDRPSEKPDKAA